MSIDNSLVMNDHVVINLMLIIVVHTIEKEIHFLTFINYIYIPLIFYISILVDIWLYKKFPFESDLYSYPQKYISQVDMLHTFFVLKHSHYIDHYVDMDEQSIEKEKRIIFMKKYSSKRTDFRTKTDSTKECFA
jgi:hypothetical protein